MVEASAGDGEHLGVTTPTSVHIEMTSESGAFYEVADKPDPVVDGAHVPPHDLGNTTPGYILSQNVKEYKEYDDDKTISNVVVSFNSKLLYSRCKPASPIYDDSIDIDLLWEHFCVCGRMVAK